MSYIVRIHVSSDRTPASSTPLHHRRRASFRPVRCRRRRSILDRRSTGTSASCQPAQQRACLFHLPSTLPPPSRRDCIFNRRPHGRLLPDTQCSPSACRVSRDKNAQRRKAVRRRSVMSDARRTPPSQKCSFPWADLVSHQIRGSLGQPESHGRPHIGANGVS